MSTATVDVLRGIPILKNLNEDECRDLAEIAHVMTFNPGEVVLREGKQSQNLWVVLEGECEVFRKDDEDPSREIILARLGRHENFGEMSFFHPAPHSASVRAKSEVKLFRLGRSGFDRLIEAGNTAAYKLAYNSVESLAGRLRRMDDWVARLVKQAEDGGRLHEWSHFRNKLFTKWSL